jgi:hypothetical protein
VSARAKPLGFGGAIAQCGSLKCQILKEQERGQAVPVALAIYCFVVYSSAFFTIFVLNL